MKLVTVNVFLNDCPEHRFQSFEPAHCQFVSHLAVTFPAQLGGKVTVQHLLEETFEQLNIGGVQDPVVKRYRAAGHRSLSVGDVVEVDGVRHVCMPSGWKELV